MLYHNTLYPGASGFDAELLRARDQHPYPEAGDAPARVTYAVVLTCRLLDEDGQPALALRLRQPHLADPHPGAAGACPGQYGLATKTAFTWSCGTMSVTRDIKAVRDGLYGQGVLKRLEAGTRPRCRRSYAIRENTPGSTINLRTPGDEFRLVAENVPRLRTTEDRPQPAGDRRPQVHRLPRGLLVRVPAVLPGWTPRGTRCPCTSRCGTSTR